MRYPFLQITFIAVVVVTAVGIPQPPLVRGEAAQAIDAELRPLEPLLEKYCVRCHGDEEVEADIDLSGPITQLRMLQDRSVWLNVIEQVEIEEMPPKAPLPDDGEMAAMIRLVNRAINEVDWQALHDPGRISLARLTVDEYRNTIRDVFEIDLQAGRFLGKDPEGNTGFTNDRDALTFPLFAFDNFMREAERVVDTYLGYAEKPWAESYDLVESWRKSSDRSVELAEDESAVILKERNAPFQINLEMPFAGMYRIELEASVDNGEPVSAMHVMVNGESVDDLIVRGTRPKKYSVTLALAAGANVLSLGFAPDRAPIIQKEFVPRVVPDEIAREILQPKVPKFPMPDRLGGNEQAKKAWQRLNKTIREFELCRRLADHLVATDQVDYEIQNVSSINQIKRFGPSKVPFNLSAGSIAVFLKIPQKKLEKQIEEVTGFSHAVYAKSAKAYLAEWKKKYPERVRKNAGRIALTRATLSSHALPGESSSPVDLLASAATSEQAREQMLRKLGTRAYGRRIEESEFAVLDRIYRQTMEETSSHSESLRDALVALLVSPDFVIQFTDPESTVDGMISQQDFARRLSRFLWLSVPDQRLRSLAFRQKLGDPKVVRTTVDRMIDDPRFGEMAELFVEQWLDLENLDIFGNGVQLKSHILAAMREEPARLFHHVFEGDRSLLDLIDPGYSFLNESLAMHYEVPGIEGQQLRKVALEDRRRGGLLGMAGILAATSTTERTSPVTRGAFIVELLLGEDLPPPPPSVPELNTKNKARTIREELEIHREDRACSGCHERIDPFGFVLENYDQFGAWRDKDRGKTVDASTRLRDGTEVNGLEEFKRYLVEKRKQDFVRNLVERMFEFALGREVQYSDEAMIRRALEALERDGVAARTLIYEIVDSEAFRMQMEFSTGPNAPRSGIR